MSVVLAGVPVDKTLVCELAIRLRRRSFAHTADLLEGCVAAGLSEAALTEVDRQAILTVLGDRSPGLAELRSALAPDASPQSAPST